MWYHGNPFYAALCADFGVPNLCQCAENALASLQTDDASIEWMMNLDQRSKDWMKIRPGRVSGSVFASCMDMSFFNPAIYQLWKALHPHCRSPDTPAIIHGKLGEPVAEKDFEADIAEKAEKGQELPIYKVRDYGMIVPDKTRPYIGASPDGLVIQKVKEEEGRLHVKYSNLEIKCPSSKYGKKVKPEHWAQMQLCMWCENQCKIGSLAPVQVDRSAYFVWYCDNVKGEGARWEQRWVPYDARFMEEAIGVADNFFWNGVIRLLHWGCAQWHGADEAEHDWTRLWENGCQHDCPQWYMEPRRREPPVDLKKLVPTSVYFPMLNSNVTETISREKIKRKRETHQGAPVFEETDDADIHEEAYNPEEMEGQ